MSRIPFKTFSRRHFLAGGAALISSSALAQEDSGNSQQAFDPLRPPPEPEPPVQRNISAFRAKTWRPYFDNLRNGAILVDIDSRALHYWSADGTTYKLFPSSVPLSDDLTRRGRTKVVRKVEGPSWSPTPNMLKRNPEWPAYVPPGPDNPLGTHALYLSWKYYRIHGTHDTRKIGRKSSNGCIGLYNEHIAELFSFAKVGTQVLLI
ncbi:L,D-transpeptidase [Leisingera caerulea]|uniref:L,D-transpeptidase n=1 Tax=Leisingera caerulea TaxID=506591 RepID=UPI00040789DE|nr:L,D-transpeptidase family protein [Leisingera caerulea]UWQ83387.1 L,D-transpeptidase family protein [Leisingera caerulea]